MLAVALSKAGGQVTHSRAQAAQSLLSVLASGAGGKLPAVCSVNPRAVKARRFPFPQSCKMSAHRQNSSNSLPTEGNNNGKRQPATLPAAAALSQPPPPPPLHSETRQRAGSEVLGSSALRLTGRGARSPDTTVGHAQGRAQSTVSPAAERVSDTPTQDSELKPYRVCCALCDQPVLATSACPHVQAELCQKL